MAEAEIKKGGIGGRYELREQAGVGGSGVVYKAWDTQLHRNVAFKRLKREESLDKPGDDKWLKEAMTLASIQHPNILTVFDCGEDAEGAYVVTEFLSGESLNHFVRGATFNLAGFEEAVVQTLEGMIAAHHEGVIHRDIKPSNIMVVKMASGALQYKILDFGLARVITQPTIQTLHGDKSIYGTIYYLAPEQISRQPLDARTDLYAMGCVYYYMLTKKQAFDSESVVDIITAHMEHRVTPLNELRPDLPRDMCEWVMRMFSKLPADRPQSAKEALDEFKRLRAGIHPHTATIRISTGDLLPRGGAPVVKIAPKPAAASTPGVVIPARRRPWPVLAALALAAVVVAGGFVWHSRVRVEPPPASVPAPAVESQPAPSLPASLSVDYFAEMDRPDLLRKYFEQIKDYPLDYGKIGSVGEALGMLLFSQRYAGNTNIQILNGLCYEDLSGNTAGELDLLVWKRDERKALSVYEIKISDNLPGSIGKARSQMKRIRESVKARSISRFVYPLDDGRTFKPEQFDAVETYGVMGSQGAIEAGFDVELDISRVEAYQLQKALIQYKQRLKRQSRVWFWAPWTRG